VATIRPYELLCCLIPRHGRLKLGRSASGWTLEVVLPPGQPDERWRAAGVLFPDFTELDDHAYHLLQWAEASRANATGRRRKK
jgi:hypothetical protein